MDTYLENGPGDFLAVGKLPPVCPGLLPVSVGGDEESGPLSPHQVDEGSDPLPGKRRGRIALALLLFFGVYTGYAMRRVKLNGFRDSARQ